MQRIGIRLFAPPDDSGGGGGGTTTATGMAPAPQAGDGGQDTLQGQAPATTTPSQADGSPPKSKSADEYERIIAELRRENAAHRVKARELDELRKQIEDEKLSEKERLEKRLAEAQREREQALVRAQESVINAEIKAELAAQGLKNPRLARLIDRDRLEFDENGTPTNIGQLIADLLKEMPELKQIAASSSSSQSVPRPTSGGATNPARSTTSGGATTITKEYVASILSRGQAAWNALSPDEQRRISTFIQQGGLHRR